MKKLILLLSIVSAALFSSGATFGHPAAKPAPAVADDESMYRVTRFEGQPITGVTASNGFRVEVRRSAGTSVQVEVPAEWQQRLICTLSPDGTLSLSMNFEGLRNPEAGQCNAVVELPAFDALRASNGARITCEGGFTSSDVLVKASTGGSIRDLALKASRATVDISTGGSVRGLDLTAEQAAITGATGGSLSGLVLKAGQADIEAATAFSLNDATVDVPTLSCKAATASSVTLSHTGRATKLHAGTCGSIRISGSTGTLAKNDPSETAGSIVTDGYRVRGE